LLVAFSAVAVVSVVLLTVAALIGTDRGVTAAQDADRLQAALRAAAAVAQATKRRAAGPQRIWHPRRR
jgi:two-component system sensor histidine kinase BaeS